MSHNVQRHKMYTITKCKVHITYCNRYKMYVCFVTLYIMQHSCFDNFMFCMLTLCAAALSNIHVLQRLCCVHLRYVATPAELQMATLGIDFLRAYKLSVDPAAGKLVQDGTGLTFSPPSPFPVGRQLRLMCPQLFLVLLARQPLHQLFLVLLARQPLQHLLFPVLMARRPLLLHFPLHPHSPVIGSRPPMVARRRQSWAAT